MRTNKKIHENCFVELNIYNKTRDKLNVYFKSNFNNEKKMFI